MYTGLVIALTWVTNEGVVSLVSSVSSDASLRSRAAVNRPSDDADINSVLVERLASDKDAEKMPPLPLPLPLLLVMMMVMMVMPTISCSEEEDKGHGGRAWRRRHCRPAD